MLLEKIELKPEKILIQPTQEASSSFSTESKKYDRKAIGVVKDISKRGRLSGYDFNIGDKVIFDDSEKTSVEWLAALLYEERVEIMNRLLDITCAKSKYWCVLKHAAIDYVIACENQHAVRIDIAKASEQLALACSLFFGFAPMGCLRCLDEQINKGGEDGENNRP